MEAWNRVVTPRKEVREGRSFNPDEFAIALEQVVAGTAPEDYRHPKKFFSRTYFTRALKEHAGMALRRLSGKTENTAPVLTLITQFGGGKTHTLTALYHLSKTGEKAAEFPGVKELLKEIGLAKIPKVKVAVFVGNAWDPKEGWETPWIDVARQLAGDKGVAALGTAARTTPPGTETLAKVFQEAGGSVLILFDEVLNFLNRHRKMAESFHAFLQNLSVAMTGTQNSAAVISLPRSQVEMTEWDLQWQGKITKVLRRVAKDLIVNDEAEISEVVRRRLFEDLGSEKIRKNISKVYADWCFERRAQLPAEWTAVDTASTEAKAKEFLRARFEACYPFHPATLSVFQRKWQALSQYQQTRGTLAMLAQWVSWAYEHGRGEPLLTLGSAPLDVPAFRSIVLGQLGETRLVAAIDADISGRHSHARALDADTRGPLRDIHRRAATTILFESSGGQVEKVAHLIELRFALGEPQVDTTSIDTAAFALETKAFFVRRVGSDGFQIRHQPTLKKVVSDRRASLDEETEIKPALRELVKKEFMRGANIPVILFPADSADVQDSPKLCLVVMEPDVEWAGSEALRKQMAEWTKQRGKSPRLYPAALLWCVKKPGRELREKIEMWLAWKRVEKEVADGTLGMDFDKTERADIHAKVLAAENEAVDEVWGGYRFVVFADNKEEEEIRAIDLGVSHASQGETLCGRVILYLRNNGLLNESPGAAYLERNWPKVFLETGAWPLVSLRQAFLTGAMTRLIDPDAYIHDKIPAFVENGDFGLASGQNADGTYERVWFTEFVPPEDVSFDGGVFLLKKDKVKFLKEGGKPPIIVEAAVETVMQPEMISVPAGGEGVAAPSAPQTKILRLSGEIPPELWNRLGTKILPKLRGGVELQVGVSFQVKVNGDMARVMREELRQILADLGLADKVGIEDE